MGGGGLGCFLAVVLWVFGGLAAAGLVRFGGLKGIGVLYPRFRLLIAYFHLLDVHCTIF